jgi:hypothetical protein
MFLSPSVFKEGKEIRKSIRRSKGIPGISEAWGGASDPSEAAAENNYGHDSAKYRRVCIAYSPRSNFKPATSNTSCKRTEIDFTGTQKNSDQFWTQLTQMPKERQHNFNFLQK